MVGSVLAGSGRREVAYNLCRVAAFIWGTEIVCEMGNHCTTPPLSLEGERYRLVTLFNGKAGHLNY